MRTATLVTAALILGALAVFLFRDSPDGGEGGGVEPPSPPSTAGRAPTQCRADVPVEPEPAAANRDARATAGGPEIPFEALERRSPGYKEVEEWIKRLRDKRNADAFEKALDLAESGDLAAVDHLVEVLLTHEDFYWRLVAATALGRLSSWRATDALADALTDRDQLVRSSATEALSEITGHEIKSYAPQGEETARTEGQRAWREWIKANRPPR